MGFGIVIDHPVPPIPDPFASLDFRSDTNSKNQAIARLNDAEITRITNYNGIEYSIKTQRHQKDAIIIKIDGKNDLQKSISVKSLPDENYDTTVYKMTVETLPEMAEGTWSAQYTHHGTDAPGTTYNTRQEDFNTALKTLLPPSIANNYIKGLESYQAQSVAPPASLAHTSEDNAHTYIPNTEIAPSATSKVVITSDGRGCAAVEQYTQPKTSSIYSKTPHSIAMAKRRTLSALPFQIS